MKWVDLSQNTDSVKMWFRQSPSCSVAVGSNSGKGELMRAQNDRNCHPRLPGYSHTKSNVNMLQKIYSFSRWAMLGYVELSTQLGELHIHWVWWFFFEDNQFSTSKNAVSGIQKGHSAFPWIWLNGDSNFSFLYVGGSLILHLRITIAFPL